MEAFLRPLKTSALLFVLLSPNAASAQGDLREAREAWLPPATLRLERHKNDVKISIKSLAVSATAPARDFECAAKLEQRAGNPPHFYASCEPVGGSGAIWVSASLTSLDVSLKGSHVTRFSIRPALSPPVPEAPSPPVVQTDRTVPCGDIPISGFPFSACAEMRRLAGTSEQTVYRAVLRQPDSEAVVVFSDQGVPLTPRSAGAEAVSASFQAEVALAEYLVDARSFGTVEAVRNDRFFAFEKGPLKCKGFVRLNDDRQALARGLFCRISDGPIATNEVRFITDQLVLGGGASMTRRAAEDSERALGLAQTDRQRLQSALTSLGFDTRGTDGVFGARSREMIAAWQRSRAEPATGFLTASQHRALLQESSAAIDGARQAAFDGPWKRERTARCQRAPENVSFNGLTVRDGRFSYTSIGEHHHETCAVVVNPDGSFRNDACLLQMHGQFAGDLLQLSYLSPSYGQCEVSARRGE